jgi:hypothetical protein
MDEGESRRGPTMNGEAEDRTPEEVRAEIEETRALGLLIGSRRSR